jgi:hypothetical protein
VTVKADGSFSVDRVVCAVDCGIAVNPDIVARAAAVKVADAFYRSVESGKRESVIR